MRNICLCFFFSCLFLFCTDKNKLKTENEQPNTVVGIVQMVETEQEAAEGDYISEENSLGFFNPIGILGTGVINIELYVEDKNQEYVHFDELTIYNDSGCKDVFCSYDLNRAWDPPEGLNIIPIYNSIDYGWYCFVCTGSNTDSYEIAINRTGKKCIKKDKNVKYYSWEGFFNAVFTVNPTDANPLRESPSDNAAIVNPYPNGGDVEPEPEDYYQEIRLQDEWLRIKYEKSGIEGWLRWRRGNDIIADISISW